jgi:hypothetical protein
MKAPAKRGGGKARTASSASSAGKAVALRIKGCTYQQIANALGLSEAQAYKLVSAELARIRQDTAEKAEELRQIEVDRLDALLHRLNSELATAIDVGDIARLSESILKIATRRAAFLGLDGPARIEHIIPDSPRAALASALASIAPRPTPDDGG